MTGCPTHFECGYAIDISGELRRVIAPTSKATRASALAGNLGKDHRCVVLVCGHEIMAPQTSKW